MSDTSTKSQTVSMHQKIRWLPADTETPISLFLKAAGNGEGILLESAEVDGRWGRYSILACDFCLHATCSSGLLQLQIEDARFAPLAAHSGQPFMSGLRGMMNDLEIASEKTPADLPPITRALYGYLGFGMASIFNPHLAKTLPVDEADCHLALPATVLLFDHLYNRLCQISLGKHRDITGLPLPGEENAHAASVAETRATPDQEGYKQYVREIRDLLCQGEAIQVVPSTRFSIPFQGDPFTLYRRMRRHNASPYMFYMRFPEITLFGSSPEVMVRCARDTLQLSPIAGTRRRGADDAEDMALARELLADPKDRAEHVMLVDLGRNDLGRIARPDSVRVDRFMEVEKFSHVMHLTSSVSASLDQGGDARKDALDVLASTFPAGTVSGAPKYRAMEIIRSLEGRSRGPYAGCIGWIGLDKDSVNLDMGITIRSMWVKDGQLCWQAGGGIVHDSDPDLEWNEVYNKSAIMRLVLEPEDDIYVPSHR